MPFFLLVCANPVLQQLGGEVYLSALSNRHKVGVMDNQSNPTHLPSLIMVVSIIATKDLHVLQAAFARAVFQELGVSCVQFKLSWLRLDRTKNPLTGCAQVSERSGVPNLQDLMPDAVKGSWLITAEIKWTINTTHLNQNHSHPHLVYGKIVFHETSPWYQKDWWLLC